MVGLAGLHVAGGTAGAGEQFPSSAKQVILDSGTSALLVSKTDADSIHQARPMWSLREPPAPTSDHMAS